MRRANYLAITRNHEPHTLLELQRWIARMIQSPEVMTHMPIHGSEEGLGEGSFAQLMGKALGASSVALAANPRGARMRPIQPLDGDLALRVI
jgi:hypothetical protein